MTLAQLLLSNLCLIAGIMLVLWLVSLPIKNSSIVDIFWGMGFVVVAWVSFFAMQDVSIRGWLVSILTSLWGLRLATYLLWRNVGKGEDYRYQAMRRWWGSKFTWISLFTVFWLQGLIMWLVALPIQSAFFGSTALGWLDYLGCGLWLIGWMFESVGDWQLARFKANPTNSGKVLDRDLVQAVGVRGRHCISPSP